MGDPTPERGDPPRSTVRETDETEAGETDGNPSGRGTETRPFGAADPRIPGRLAAALSEGLGLSLVANWFYLPLSGPDSAWGHLALAAFGGVVVLAGVVAHRGDTPWLVAPFPIVGCALLATTPGIGLLAVAMTRWANTAALATILALPLVWHLWQTSRARHAERKRV